MQDHESNYFDDQLKTWAKIQKQQSEMHKNSLLMKEEVKIISISQF